VSVLHFGALLALFCFQAIILGINRQSFGIGGFCYILKRDYRKNRKEHVLCKDVKTVTTSHSVPTLGS